MACCIKTFIKTKSPHPLSQEDLDAHSAEVNLFLDTILAVDVLDVLSTFAPGGKDGLRSTFVTTVIYLEV